MFGVSDLLSEKSRPSCRKRNDFFNKSLITFLNIAGLIYKTQFACDVLQVDDAANIVLSF